MEVNCCADKIKSFSINSREDHWWENVPEVSDNQKRRWGGRKFK